MTFSLPLPWLVVAALVAYAPWIARAPRPELARAHAVGVTAGVFAALLSTLIVRELYAGGAMLSFPLWGGVEGPSPWTLGIDSLSGTFAITTAAIALAIALGMPARFAGPKDLASLVVLEAALLTSFMATDLRLFTAAWAASLAPLALAPLANARRRLGGVVARAPGLPLRAVVVRAALCLIPLGVAVAALETTSGPQRSGWLAAEAIRAIDQSPLSGGTISFLLLASALARLGVAPASGWLSVTLTRGAPVLGVLTVAAQPGAYLLARLAVPVAARAHPHALDALTILGALTAVTGALAANAQRSWRRMLASLATVQAGLMAIGLGSREAPGVGGSLAFTVAFALTWTGLAVTLMALEARSGSSDIAATRGGAQGLPALGTAAFTFGFLLIGYPGGLAFVSEDLLIFGAFEHHFGLGLAVIVSMALAGLALVKALASSLLGEPRGAGAALLAAGRDLLPRERLAAGFILVSVVLLGLAPALLTGVVEAPAQHLGASLSPHGHGAAPR